MSQDLLLATYYTQFKKLRRDYKHGGAPHKPILLLAIADLIRQGTISSKFIRITPELVLQFKDLWAKLVTTQHSPNFALPFFHMRSEPFWTLVTFPGFSIETTSSGSVKSLKNLQQTVAYAEIDFELFAVLTQPDGNKFLVECLLDTYFRESRSQLINSQDLGDVLVKQMLTETGPSYSQRIQQLQRDLPKETFEEEVFVRGGLFKREIPKLYGFQCAISGSKITTSSNIQMIDACHIVPFAHSKDDTITNGISLTPTLHRAFDRGILRIDPDYRVRISEIVIENPDSPFSITQFEGQLINLPANSQHYPSLTNLEWHWKQSKF